MYTKSEILCPGRLSHTLLILGNFIYLLADKNIWWEWNIMGMMNIKTWIVENIVSEIFQSKTKIAG